MAYTCCCKLVQGCAEEFWRKKVFPIEEADITGLTVSDEHSDVLDAVLRLKPPKYRDVIYLYFYEGYSAVETAAFLRQKENTVYTWLDRAKKQLEDLLGDESFEL